MGHVGIRELKHDTTRILRRVRERGEEIDVTYRGRVVARIVPVAPETRGARRRRATWRQIDELAREIGRRWPKGISAARAVRESRRG